MGKPEMAIAWLHQLSQLSKLQQPQLYFPGARGHQNSSKESLLMLANLPPSDFIFKHFFIAKK